MNASNATWRSSRSAVKSPGPHQAAATRCGAGVQPATVQRILRHSSITVTTGTYVEVIEAVQRDALDSMGSLFATAPDANT